MLKQWGSSSLPYTSAVMQAIARRRNPRGLLKEIPRAAIMVCGLAVGGEPRMDACPKARQKLRVDVRRAPSSFSQSTQEPNDRPGSALWLRAMHFFACLTPSEQTAFNKPLTRRFHESETRFAVVRRDCVHLRGDELCAVVVLSSTLNWLAKKPFCFTHSRTMRAYRFPEARYS
jgi:hypothetical protein